MGLGPRLDIRVAQSLVMTQQLQQAIKLLALSNLELEAALAEEVANNPLLEMADGDVARSEDREFGDDAAEPTGSDELIGALGGADDSPVDHDLSEAARETDADYEIGGSADPDAEAFDFDRLAACETGLCEHLMAQLSGTGGTIGRLAGLIVHELEDSGYLATPLDLIAEEGEATLAEAEEALALVQSLDPAGVAARSLEECIALQAKAADRYDPCMQRLIANMDLLAKGRMKDLKRICDVDDEDLADMVRELRSYDPKPGANFVSSEPASAIADVFVTKTKEGYAIELNEAALPKVLVNRTYHAELKAAGGNKESRAWLSDKLQSANWLTRALDQRAQTILKVTCEIVKQQRAFFEEGVSAMKPLTMAKVAEAVEMHESTVSRVASNKYLDCERGLFELRYFFGSGVASDDNEGAAAEAVKAEIKALIADETAILSDDALVGLLKAKGFDLARRTVAKYREACGIGSSVQRRRQRKMGL